jgi:hypothetical protein
MTANALEDILQQLPDERATKRLLNVLEKLENNLKAQRKGQTSAMVSNAELKTLKDENLSLRFKQKKAADRLDKLLSKLPGLFPELTEANKEAAA